MGRDGMGWREVGGNGAGWLEGEGKRWRGMPVGRGATGWNGKGRWNEPVGFLGRIAAKRIVRHVGAKSKRSTLGDGTCSVLLRGFSNLLLGRPLTGLMRPAPRASSSLSVVGRAVGRARRADSNRRQVDRQHLDPGQDDLFTVPQAQDHGGEVAVVPGTRDDSANNLTGLLVT